MFWIPLVKEEPPARQYPHGEGIKGVGDVPWEKFARSTAVWAIFVAQCTQGMTRAYCHNCRRLVPFPLGQPSSIELAQSSPQRSACIEVHDRVCKKDWLQIEAKVWPNSSPHSGCMGGLVVPQTVPILPLTTWLPAEIL